MISTYGLMYENGEIAGVRTVCLNSWEDIGTYDGELVLVDPRPTINKMIGWQSVDEPNPAYNEVLMQNVNLFLSNSD